MVKEMWSSLFSEIAGSYHRLVGGALLVIMVSVICLKRLGRGSGSGNKHLPPAPRGWPLVGNLFQVAFSGKPFMYVVRDLREQFGPIFTLKMGQKTLIIITCPELAHEALIEKGTLFANRPPDTPTKMYFSANKCSVNSAEYGSVWRTLRRNLVSEMLNLSRVKDFSWIREWAIDRLIQRLEGESREKGSVSVLANVRFSVFSILLCMCFARQVEEDTIIHVDDVMKEILLIVEPQIHDFLPILRPLFAKQWKRIRELRRLQMDSILPLINARRAVIKDGLGGGGGGDGAGTHAYIDSLMKLELPDGRGKVTDEELVTLCSELLTAGTDTTSTALEWAMLRMVMHQDIQETLYREIVEIVGDRKVEEKDIENLPYLNAVVKETLRRHPPGHFVLSHAVTQDCKLRGYDIPYKANVEFYTAWMSFDPQIWPDPMAFNPQRFLDPGNDVDITGNKQVKMMPFGVGRRICPALGLGTLHINLILARMVQAFHWTCPDGHTLDPTEKFAFTVVMKNPLQASIKKRAPIRY